jgi:uncharacterized protein YaaQ
MKLVLTIIGLRDAGRLSAALAARGLRSTRLASSGGFLRESNATLLIGCADERVDEVLTLIRTSCKPRRQVVVPLHYLGEEAQPVPLEPVDIVVGGATSFVLALEPAGTAGACRPPHKASG